MDTKARCQSCGMPLGEGFYAPNTDGTFNTEYCLYCMKNGEFLQPDITMQDMIDMAVSQMMQSEQFTEEKAKQLAGDYIPSLKRWKTAA